MSVDIQDKIANLRLKIEAQEKEATMLEQECDELKKDLSEFEERYNKFIKPLIDQIDAVKSALEKLRDLHFMQQMGEKLKMDSLWRNNGEQPKDEYIPPHERDFAIPEPIEKPIERKPKNIKSLYRQLARQYHPDLAYDEADRDRRTKIMSLINTAYQEDDFDSLEALNESQSQPQFDGEPINSQLSLDLLIYRQLQKKYQDLSIKIRDLKEWRYELRHGPLMQLKLEESLAKARGEDLIGGLTEDMQAEYWRYMQELDELRQQVD